MIKDDERERLIKQMQAANQKRLEAAYEVGKGLLLIKEHESREDFIEILMKHFGLTEIDGEAICKHMRQSAEPEAAERISEIMLNATLRRLEGTDA